MNAVSPAGNKAWKRMETESTPSSSLDLQRYRTYLLLLARSHDKMGGDEASDLVQKTMLAAHAQRAEFRGESPAETRRGLPGEPDSGQSRYIEATVNGILIGCLYLPNGNPAPGPKFDDKLAWFEAFIGYAESLLARGVPVVLAGDYNVMPTDLDVYKPERWVDDALFRPEVRDAFHRLAAQGWTDALRTLHPGERTYTFWDYFRNAFGRDDGIRIDHLLSRWYNRLIFIGLR